MADGDVPFEVHERRLAEEKAVADLYSHGATDEDIDLIDEIARRMRDRSFTCREIVAAADAEAAAGRSMDLIWHLRRSLGDKAGGRSLGRRLEKLQGRVVERQGGERDGATWVLHWPRRAWGPGSAVMRVWGPQTHTDRGDAESEMGL